jgi:hypothetical protein
MVSVVTSSYIKNQFLKNPQDLNDLIDDFIDYINNPNIENFHFGRDIAYHTHTVAGKYILMHVHLTPTVDMKALNMWHDIYERNINKKKGVSALEKTSNACLVYIEEPKDKFLFVSIFREPDAHKLCHDRQFMKKIVSMAEDYYFHGKVT